MNGVYRPVYARYGAILRKLTLSYNAYLFRQIFELRHSPSSGKKRMKMQKQKEIRRKYRHRSNEAMKPKPTERMVKLSHFIQFPLDFLGQRWF